jgi:hypothetical protein
MLQSVIRDQHVYLLIFQQPGGFQAVRGYGDRGARVFHDNERFVTAIPRPVIRMDFPGLRTGPAITA